MVRLDRLLRTGEPAESAANCNFGAESEAWHLAREIKSLEKLLLATTKRQSGLAGGAPHAQAKAEALDQVSEHTLE